MVQWEYQITFHELPTVQSGEPGKIIECDQTGSCFVHNASAEGIQWLANLFREKGIEGWELVQSGYHNREVLCIWKKKIEIGRKD
jgi:hypothetical protein